MPTEFLVLESSEVEVTLKSAVEDALLDYQRLTKKSLEYRDVDLTLVRLIVEHLVKGLDDPMPTQNEFSRGADWGMVFMTTSLYERLGGKLLSASNNIISNDEVKKKHFGNFGPDTARFVIDEGVIDHAFGYGGGSTRTAILISHGLIRKPRTMCYKSPLTEKGFDYLRSLVSPSQVKRLIQR
jgi:hypothetical protein